MLFHERNRRIHQTYRTRGDKQFRAAFPAKFTFQSVSRSAALTMNHNDSFLFRRTEQLLLRYFGPALILTKSPSGLSTEMPRIHHLPQQWTRPVVPPAPARAQDLRHIETGLQPK